MLLEFRTKNYRSFKDEMVFSMMPAKYLRELDYSIQKHKIKNKEYKALSSAVIYGANASGKTNIIGAMETFKSIVTRGNINNVKSDGITDSPNYAARKLELIPFYEPNFHSPVFFSIKFIENDLCIEYSLELDLGPFLSENYDRKILNETLKINESLIFVRNQKQNLELSNFDNKDISKYLNDEIKTNFEAAKIISKNGLNDKELFLTNGFKTIFSLKLADLIIQWFMNKFIIIFRSDAINIRPVSAHENEIYVNKYLVDLAKEIGTNSDAIGFVSNKDNNDAVLCSIINQDNQSVSIPVDMFESLGTIRMVNEFPLIVEALKNGNTLIVDEFDAHIHPMLLMNLINIFHNDDINTNHGQLIFNTHNPIFLNSSLFRRDELKFVEKDDDTNTSIHYSLSDFRDNNSKLITTSENYMKKYFINRYGAIKDIDFAPLLNSLLDKGEDKND